MGLRLRRSLDRHLLINCRRGGFAFEGRVEICEGAVEWSRLRRNLKLGRGVDRKFPHSLRWAVCEMHFGGEREGREGGY